MKPASLKNYKGIPYFHAGRVSDCASYRRAHCSSHPWMVDTSEMTFEDKLKFGGCDYKSARQLKEDIDEKLSQN